MFKEHPEIKEKFLNGEYTWGDFLKPFIVLGDDEYFVMGDNREDSLVSRYFGPVKKENIIGNTNFIIFPFNHFGKVN